MRGLRDLLEAVAQLDGHPLAERPSSSGELRVDAGWDRRAPGAAAINQLRADDVPLDRPAADHAAGVRRALGVSVAEAHLAAVIASTAGPVAVLTSDVADIRRIAGYLDADTTRYGVGTG